MRPTVKGFTLVEVVVALAIIGWVLGSTYVLIHQYADQRVMMRERFLAGQVAWNILMEEYRRDRGIVSPNEAGIQASSEGEQDAGGQLWTWHTEVDEAMGEGLYRHRVQVGLADASRASASRALYLVQEAEQP